MWFNRMSLEDWFNRYQYAKYNIGESAVKYLSFSDLGVDLDGLPLRYGHHEGSPELRALIAEDYNGLTPEQIVVTNGAAEALFDLAASLLNPGDHVIVEHPNYPSNYEVPRSLGCKVDLLPLRFENNFKPDLDELRELVTPQTKLISLTHPNNPTGSMISKRDLEQLLDIVESHNYYLIFDETYRELSFNNKLPTAASLSSRAISVSTMSKAYGLPGIRIGWIATKDKSILEAVLATREQVSICNSAIGEAVATSVLQKKDKFLTNARQHAAKNLQLVIAWMEAQENLEWVKPEAGVVCFPRIKQDILPDPEELYRSLAEEYETFIIPGRCFEMDNRYFRIGYGGRSEELSAGLKNVETALQDLREG